MIAAASLSPDVSFRILIVCEAGDEASRLSTVFKEQGFAPSRASSASEVDGLMVASVFDLIVVDDCGMQDLWRSIAANSTAPVLLLADSAGVIERILALELGVDAVLAKPVHQREMVSMAKALIRRTRRVMEASAGFRDVKPDWVLDAETRRFTGPSGKTASLSPSELALLQLFLEHPGLLVSAERAVGIVGTNGAKGTASNVNFRVTLARLRRRLEQAGYHADVIRTVRGVGYVFLPEETSAAKPGSDSEVEGPAPVAASARASGVLH